MINIKTNEKYIKTIFIILIILLAIPSIVYIATGNSITNLTSDYIYNLIGAYFDIFFINRIFFLSINTIGFFTIFSLISIFYILIIKNYKTIFKNDKEIIKYVIIVSALFALILPMTSTDIFYYISTGWSEAKYGVNPYYTSVYELKENNNINDDEILNKMPKVWQKQTIVYGPLWPFICKILTTLSFGSLPLALAIFKIFNLCIHLINCVLIQKLSKRKQITLIYALNPLVLFEGLTNLHNDILLICFILIGLYFAIKKKNIFLSIIALSIATSIKYVAILIVPFLVIYYYRNEKVSKRILKAIGLAVIFLLVLIGIYLLYTRDLQVLQGIITQQAKYSKSLLLTVYLLINGDVAVTLSTIFMGLFAIIYLIEVFINLFKKDISLKSNLRIPNTMIILLLFFVITNFQVWYIIWLMPLLMWQKTKTIKSIINLTIASELATTIYFALGEIYVYDSFFWSTMIILWILFSIINVNKIIKKEKI